MRSFLLSKVAIPLHLAFIALYLACVSVKPGSVVEYLPLAWFVASLFEITLLFPSARKGEEVHAARMRVRAAIRKDPVMLMGIVGFVFILLQTLNGPREIKYNANSMTWEFVSARIRDFPACVNQLDSVQGLFWVLLATAAILVIRNGVGKKGRMLLLKYLVAISSGLAVYGLATYLPGKSESALQPFATFPNALTAGMYFFMHFCVGCSLFAMEMASAAESEVPAGKWSARLLFLATVANLAGAIFTLSCLAIAASAVALVVLTIYSSIYLKDKLDSAKRLRMTAIGVILVGIVAFVHFIAYPDNSIHGRIDKIFKGPWISEVEQAEHNTLTKIAGRMFKDNAAHGVGTWGFGNEICFGKYIEDDEWDSLADTDGHYTDCDNDHLQFLAEYGVIGYVVLSLPVLFLIGIVMYRLAMEFRPRNKKSADSTTSSEHESVPFMQRITPCTFSLFLATIPPLVLSFRHSIFRYPLLMLTWTIFLTILSTSLRKPAQREAR